MMTHRFVVSDRVGLFTSAMRRVETACANGSPEPADYHSEKRETIQFSGG